MPIHFLEVSNSMPITSNLFPVHNTLLGTTSTCANLDNPQDLKLIVSKTKVCPQVCTDFCSSKAFFFLWGSFLHSFHTGCSLYLEHSLLSSPGKLLTFFRTRPNQHVPQIRVSTSLQTVRPLVCKLSPPSHLSHKINPELKQLQRTNTTFLSSRNN